MRDIMPYKEARPILEPCIVEIVEKDWVLVEYARLEGASIKQRLVRRHKDLVELVLGGRTAFRGEGSTKLTSYVRKTCKLLVKEGRLDAVARHARTARGETRVLTCYVPTPERRRVVAAEENASREAAIVAHEAETKARAIELLKQIAELDFDN